GRRRRRVCPRRIPLPNRLFPHRWPRPPGRPGWRLTVARGGYTIARAERYPRAAARGEPQVAAASRCPQTPYLWRIENERLSPRTNVFGRRATGDGRRATGDGRRATGENNIALSRKRTISERERRVTCDKHRSSPSRCAASFPDQRMAARSH